MCVMFSLCVVAVIFECVAGPDQDRGPACACPLAGTAGSITTILSLIVQGHDTAFVVGVV